MTQLIHQHGFTIKVEYYFSLQQISKPTYTGGYLPLHGTIISMQQSHFNMTQFIQLAEFIIKGEDHSSLLQISKPAYSRGQFPCNATYTSSTKKYAIVHAEIQQVMQTYNTLANSAINRILY